MDFRVVRKLDLKLGVQGSSLEVERRWATKPETPEGSSTTPPTPRKAGPGHDSCCSQGLLTHKEGHRVLRRGQGSGARTPDFLAL